MTVAVSEAGLAVCQECEDDPLNACRECLAGGAWEPANAQEIIDAILAGREAPAPVFLLRRRVRLGR